jgi:hypothetical protein
VVSFKVLSRRPCETTKTSVRIAGNGVEIRIGYLQNTRAVGFHYTNVVGIWIVFYVMVCLRTLAVAQTIPSRYIHT